MATRKTTKNRSRSDRESIPPPSKPSRQVREAMDYLCSLPTVELREALVRSGVIYQFVNEVAGGMGGEVAAGATAPGTWTALYKCDREPIANLKSDHIYRICNNSKSKGHVNVYVDGKITPDVLSPGECTDVEGKKIEVHMPSDSAAKGTYEKLD